MELKEALESIVADMTRKGEDKDYICANFLAAVSYIDQALSFQQSELPLAQEMARRLFLKSFQEMGLVERKYAKLNYLIRQLSWYEMCRLKGEDVNEVCIPALGKKIIQKYDTLISPAERALVGLYFADTIAGIREKVEAAKRKPKSS
jgi:hypothetical protein